MLKACSFAAAASLAAAAALAGCHAEPTTESMGPIKVGEEMVLALTSPTVAPTTPVDAPTLVWSHTLSHPGATYVAPHFSRFDLPEDAYLVLRSPDGSRSRTYRAQGKTVDGAAMDEFWAMHIAGDEAVLELYSSRPVARGAFVIDRLALGLESFEDLVPDFELPEEEALCGADDAGWAKCYEGSTAYEESRAVARLLINGSGGCTGWLVGSEGHLMTNEHCIGSASAAANTNYEFMAEGATCSTNCARGGACPGTVEADTATLVKLNSTLDYALVKLPTNITSEYGYMQLRSSGAVLNEQIYIPQHPARWGKKIAIESTHSSDTGGVCRVNSLTRPPCSGGSYNDVGYYCDTQGGSSGSPVLGFGDNLVVALHHCANCPNRGVPIQLVIDDLGSDLPANALPGGSSDTEPPTASLDAPADGATVDGTVTIEASASDNTGVTRVAFSAAGVPLGDDTSAPYTMDWDSRTVGNGSHVLEVVAYDAAGNTASDSVTVNVDNAGSGGVAVYNPGLGAPACAEVGPSCDSGTLLDGRGNMSGGAEPNQPNTLGGSCADGNSGTYHNDESIDRIRVTSASGDLVEGGTATISVDVWVWGASSDHLDLYYTGDANSPSWTYLTTVEPTANGLQTLTASYTLPAGSLQAVRGNFRYNGSTSSCSGGNYDDADDLAFAVGGGGPQPGCTTIYSTDFESGAAGWTHSSDSTCTTGDWTVGEPEEIVDGNVTTQVGGDHSAAGVNAWFTAANSGAGTDDVDGGVCITRSGVIDASAYASVEVSMWYFHGQRDAGDDASGDFFRIEVSTDGGATFDRTLVASGDVTSNAAWTELTATIDNPGQLVLRVQASDGAGPGDLVEAGIDDVEVCAPE